MVDVCVGEGRARKGYGGYGARWRSGGTRRRVGCGRGGWRLYGGEVVERGGGEGEEAERIAVPRVNKGLGVDIERRSGGGEDGGEEGTDL